MASYRIIGPVAVSWGGTVGAMGVTGATTGPVSVSSTNTYKTTPMSVVFLQSCSFQPVWTGTPTGTFTVYVSNDQINWDLLPASVTGNPAGSAGHTTIPCYGFSTAWIQLWYTNASGSGTVAATFVGKTR